MGLGTFSQAQWLDETRLVGYSRLFCILFAAAAAIWIALSPTLIDLNGKPIGTDFMNVWAAGKLALAGDPSSAYDYARHFEVQRQALPWPAGQNIPYFGWHYPPMFLLLAAPLALLPYGVALFLWVLSTLLVYLACMRSLLNYRHWLIVALAFPAVFVNAEHGQNGFLTTALLGAGLLMLEKRPLFAGIMFGLLSYKPQFGLLLPIALAVGFHWRAIMAAAAAGLVAGVMSYLAFGAETWRAFFASLPLTTGYVLEQGPTGWEKIQSAFSAVRMLGGTIDQAYAAQGVMLALAAIAVVLVWRGSGGIALKGSTLVVATVLATPYVLDYDLMLLALPLGWMTVEARKTGFLPWEKICLAAVFVLPLISRMLGLLGIPVAPVMVIIFLGIILRRALNPRFSSASSGPKGPAIQGAAR